MKPTKTRSRTDKTRVTKAPIVTRCIFWEPSRSHVPLDMEHVFGEWVKMHVRSPQNRHRISEEEIGRPGTRNNVKTTLRTGEPLLSKLKIVCKTCNSGWLSRIQNAAKPHLINLIEGRQAVLRADAQKTLAAWCTMVTMTSEYLTHDSTTAAISQEERDWFRETQTPPKHWKIWIGHYPSRMSWWNHFTVPLLTGRESANLQSGDFANPNTQTTTFVIGNLFVHVMSGDADTVSGWNWPLGSPLAAKLVQIVPEKENFVLWPRQPLTDFEAGLIADFFKTVVDEASRSMTGRRLF
jgi:hypothetical protein